MGEERKNDNFSHITRTIREFVAERDWEQFHTLKDLAIGVSVEAGELLERMLWKTPEALEEELARDGADRDAVIDEIADVLTYALRLCEKLGVEPGDAIQMKLQKNREKYPVALARGKADKYTRLTSDKSD